MKKLSVFLILLFATVSFAQVKWPISSRTVQPASQLRRLLQNRFDLVEADIEELMVSGSKGTGNIYYVDSGRANAATIDGKSWIKAEPTLDDAVNNCTDNNGDWIFIAQGHTETWTAADSADLDVIGITVIGLGTGTDRPTFTYTTGTAGELVIAAANVRICNLVFQPGIADVIHAIEIEADADGSVIEFCEFLSGTSDAFEFLSTIDIPAAATDDIVIRYNKATETTAGAAMWLDIETGICDNLAVYGNEVYGDYSTSAISAATIVHTQGYYGFNTITNLNTAELVLDFQGNATGVVEFNRIFADTQAALDPGNMICFENYVSTATDKSGQIYPAYDTGTTQLNATTITAIQTSVSALTGYGFLATADDNATTTTVDCTDLEGYGDDYFNDGWSVVCFMNANSKGNVPEGEVRDITDYTSTAGVFTVAAFSAAVQADDEILVIRTHHLNPHMLALSSSSKNIWYCDDGGSGGDGKTWQTAVTTLYAAEALCAAGDTIYVGKNHAEDLVHGTQIDFNVAGVTVIGLGEGNERPTLTFDGDATSVITISAAGVTLRNLRFLPSITVLSVGIQIGAAGHGTVLDNIAFLDGETAGTDEWVDVIAVHASATDLTVKNCTYHNTGTEGHTNTFLDLTAATVTNATIKDCTINGYFAEAAVYWTNAVPVNLRVENNTITNSTTTIPCIAGTGAATGVCIGNRMYCDTLGSALDPGSMYCFDNKQVTTINAAAIDVPLVQGKTYAMSASVDECDHLDLFTVTGGEILITSFMGLVDVVIGANATTLGIECDAADGGAWDVEFSTSVAITSDAAGTRYVFTNVNPSVLTPLLKGGTEGSSILMDGWFCPEGVIYQETSADPGGAAGDHITWYMTFIPLSEGVAVVPGT